MSDLIKNPTPKTHPTILSECEPSLITDHLFETSSYSASGFYFTAPRDFATLMKLKEYHDQCTNRKTTKKDSKPSNIKSGLFNIISLSLIPLIIICGPIGLTCLYNNLAFLLMIPVLGIEYSNILDKIINSPTKNKKPLKGHTLIHVEKPLLSTWFLNNKKHKFYTSEPVNMYQINNKLFTKINKVFSTDSTTLESIDFYEFSRLYDAYTDMLVFFLVNKHQLSPTLREDYTNSLYKKSTALKREANAILKVIDAQQEFKRKAQYESEKLRQDMIDSEAQTIMPIDD